MRVCVLDCDGSVGSQPFLAKADAEIIDARDLATRLRLVASRAALASLDERLARRQERDATVFFTGSGDFHHLTYSLLRRVEESLVVIHFDNHPDWVRFPGSVNCGSWVNQALALDTVERIVTIGPCSDDLARPEMKTANLAAIREGRLEVFAWRAEPTRLWGAPVDGPGVRTENGRLLWRNLAQESWSDFIADLDERLPDCGLWFTIDKDVFAEDEAVTNWDQGAMSLAHVIEAIESLAARRRVVGVDICGDYSEPRFSDPFRALLSRSDRAKRTPPPAIAEAVNNATNDRLLRACQRVLS